MNNNNALHMANRNLIFFPTDDCSDELPNALREQNWRVYIAHSLRQARDLISRHPFHVGLCLIGQHNDEKRLSQIENLFNYSSQIKWVMGVPENLFHDLSYPSQESKLVFQYCHDYLTFPVEMEQMLFVLGHTHGIAQLASMATHNDEVASSKIELDYDSAKIQVLDKQIEKIAKEDSSVFIEGETSIEKSEIAHAIHSHSSRSNNPMIAVNCSALSSDMFHAELFGYEKGAFPGAEERKIGRIESAQGGTLFLDEISELSKEEQVNLLRFFEEREIVRMGGSEKIAIDVRIIASTYLDLDAAVREGKFRSDLYYRLRELQLNSFQLPSIPVGA
jgi:DNA-binding NtrC family response regulator